MALTIPCQAIQGSGGGQDPIDGGGTEGFCCERAQIEDGPEGFGCSGNCVSQSSGECMDAGTAEGPFIHPGGCFLSTDPAAFCFIAPPLEAEVELYFCRTSLCGNGRVSCSWVPDGSTFHVTIQECGGSACFGE